MDEKYCYSLLGVTKQTTGDELKKAYHRAARKYHPDLHPNDPDAVEKFKEVVEAYRMLVDIRTRPDTFTKVKNIINGKIKKEMSHEKTTANQEPQPGEDVETPVEISFIESLTGCKKTIEVTRLKHCQCCYDGRPTVGCPQCGGTGKIAFSRGIELRIPKRVQDKQILRIKGKGNVGDIGAASGDLLIRVKIIPDKHYSLKGNDLYYRLDITFPDAVLGIRTTLETAQGNIECNVPAGIEPGTKIMLKGKGLPDMSTGELGNMYIVPKLIIPKADTIEKIRLINEVRAMLY